MVSSRPRPHFTPGKDPVPILQEVEWAPGPVWTGVKSCPHRDSILYRPARSSVAILTELPVPHLVDMHYRIVHLMVLNTFSFFFVLLHTHAVNNVKNVQQNGALWTYTVQSLKLFFSFNALVNLPK